MLDKVKDDIKQKGLSADEVCDRDRAYMEACIIVHRPPHKSGSKMRDKKKINYFNKVVKPHHGKQTKK